jgi:hypothetical protein
MHDDVAEADDRTPRHVVEAVAQLVWKAGGGFADDRELVKDRARQELIPEEALPVDALGGSARSLRRRR